MIVDGRIAKTKKRMSLMDQPYIKDNNKPVETFIKETIAQLGENISVRRFERCPDLDDTCCLHPNSTGFHITAACNFGKNSGKIGHTMFILTCGTFAFISHDIWITIRVCFRIEIPLQDVLEAVRI